MNDSKSTTNHGENKIAPPPAQQEGASSGSYGIANCSDIEDAADRIMALSDILLTTVGGAIVRQKEEGGDLELDLCYDTVPNLLRIIHEKADEIKCLAKEECSRQMAKVKKNSLHCSHGEEPPSPLQ